MSALIETFGFGVKGWGGQLLLAVVMTLAVTLAAMAIGLVLGALVARAKALHKKLQRRYAVFYDDGGNIGKRYRRQDEAGTPFCVTIDFDTLGEKPELLDTVTLRYRDDGRQERLKISELLEFLLSKIR